MNVMNYATREVLTIAPSDSIDRAITLMEEHGIHHLVVARGGRALGLISDRDILISTGWMLAIERQAASRAGGTANVIGPTRVEQIMSRPIVGLTQANTARDAALVMLERKLGAVPILRDDVAIAIVTEADLLRWLDELAFGDTAADKFLNREVHELAARRLISVGPEVPVEDVVDIFRRFRVRHVPVATLARTLVGVISDRDVRRALGWCSVRDMQSEPIGQPASPRFPSTAADIMQKDVTPVAPTATLRAALRMMSERRIHSLPVTEGERLTGIITATDFVRAIAREEFL